jgi:hypothetical protein
MPFSGIPEGSPAQRWIQQRRPLLEKWQIEFIDPYDGAGGLGASGAQFLLVHTLTTALQSSFEKSVTGLDLRAIWNDYQVLSKNEGSGADLLAQFAGGFAHIEMGALSVEAKAWPYPELGWCIVRTHQKVPTHEHLRALDRESMSLLKAPSMECVQAFLSGPSEVFLGHLKTFAARLRELGLQAPTTLSLVNLLEKEEWCLLAKGCGALGADTVMFFYPTPERERVNGFLKRQRLSVIATPADVSYGLEWMCRN